MVEVKYRCKKCGFSEKKKTVTQIINHLAVFIITILALCGVLFLYVASKTSVSVLLTDSLVEDGFDSIAEKYGDSTTIRKQAVVYTKECGEQLDRFQVVSSYCHAYHLFNDLKDIRYLPTQEIDKMFENPEDVLEMRAGDCKEVSMLFVTMMKSLGFEAGVDCDFEEKHCIAVVPNYYNYEREDGYLVVDLTVPAIYMMYDFQDAWDYQEVGVVYE